MPAVRTVRVVTDAGTALRRFSQAIGDFTVAVSLIVLVGWARNLDVLESVLPGLAVMKVNVALSFVLCGMALRLLNRDATHPATVWTERACAGFVGLISLFTLADYIFGWRLGVDQLLFSDAASATHPGRMTFATLCSFIALAAALLIMDWETPSGHRPAQWLVIGVAFNAFLELLAYSFGVDSLYNMGPYSSLSLSTAVLFVLFPVGFLCARSDRGVMALLTADDAGGQTIRRLLPVAVLFPTGFGWLELIGQRMGLFPLEFGVTLVAVCNLLCFSVFAWRSARLAHDSIDERERRDERIIELNAELQNQYAEMETFSYSVAHDLRAPLRTVSGFATALEEDYDAVLDAEAKRYVARIVQGSRQMYDLIDALLALSRVSRQEMQRTTVDLSAKARAIAAELQAADPERKAVFTIASDVTATGDSALLHAVLQNLLSNAWKFTRDSEPAQIRFSSQVVDGETTFSISDNGVGFESKSGDEIFAPFKRLHAGEFEGTGIGLTTVARIVRRHGGRIWAASQPGMGATFSFTLGN